MADSATFLGLVAGELGVPYVYGGDSPQQGFDCSGLVQWAAGRVGISLPRGATDQMHALPATTAPLAGDLVFFNTGDGWEAGHVGVCAVPGCSTMIDAPHSGSTVGIHSVEGYGTIVGYRTLPGPATVTGRGTDPSGAAAQRILDQADGAGGAVTGALDQLDPIAAVTELLAQFPAEIVKLLTGGHTITELTLRALEIVAGGLLFAAGAVTFVLVIAEHGETGRAYRGTRRAGRTVGRRSSGAVRGAQQLVGGAGGETRRIARTSPVEPS